MEQAWAVQAHHGAVGGDGFPVVIRPSHARRHRRRHRLQPRGELEETRKRGIDPSPTHELLIEER
jgi:carbamoyl-phosphate synthase large subunit